MSDIKLKPMLKEAETKFEYYPGRMPMSIIKTMVKKVATDATTGLTSQQIFELEDEILDACYNYFKKIKKGKKWSFDLDSGTLDKP